MEDRDEQTERFVMAYLRKKGYKSTELAFKGEAKSQQLEEMVQDQMLDSDMSIRNHIFYYTSENTPAKYREGYQKLGSFVRQSLDLYKNELLRVLFPVFVHCFLNMVAKGYATEARDFFQLSRSEDFEHLHRRDLQKLEGITLPQHLQENELARAFRENKIEVKLCQYSHELLMQYLHSSESMLMLSIVNEHINLKAFQGKPSALPEEEDETTTTMVGKPLEAVEQLNKTTIHWGILEDSLEQKLQDKLAEEAAAAGQGEAGDQEAGAGKKRVAGDGAKPGVNKKSKKDAKAAGAGKVAKPATAALAGVPRVKSNIPLPKMSEDAEKASLDDLRKRIAVSSGALPSVAFYSFVNTDNSLNCVALSPDGALAVGGFSDSSLKVFDMTKNPWGGTSDAEAMGGSGGAEGGGEARTIQVSAGGGLSGRAKSKGKNYVQLQGHAGSVYAADFSPDSKFLLSASADCTVRLWHLDMNTNLVCYKGHNYPVWDVQYSPLGHYMVTASHDRTSRLWSMDRVQSLRIFAGHLSDVDCVRWHVNCNYIATGSSDKTVRLWDVQTGECMRIFTGHRGAVMALAMSPCGRFMASGDEDGAIMMWDLGSGRRVSPLLGHTASVWTLAFSGEGSMLASGSADCTVRLWDVSSSTKAARSEDKGAVVLTRRLRLVKALPTKSTPIYALRFTRRNLLLGAGAFNAARS